MDNILFRDNFNTILNLEWLGIRIENIEETGPITKFYYSIPESSTIEVDNNELNNKIKTSNDLKLLAKDVLTAIIIGSCEEEYPDDKEFIEDINKNIFEYVKFYAKVRVGEIWTKEMGDIRVKELRKDIRKATQYNEV